MLGQVVFLSDYLSRPIGLFSRSSELTFAGLSSFMLDVGIVDRDWLPREEDQGAAIKAGSDESLHLFEA